MKIDLPVLFFFSVFPTFGLEGSVFILVVVFVGFASADSFAFDSFLDFGTSFGGIILPLVCAVGCFVEGGCFAFCLLS